MDEGGHVTEGQYKLSASGEGFTVAKQNSRCAKDSFTGKLVRQYCIGAQGKGGATECLQRHNE